MRRQQCGECLYPVRTCICKSIEAVHLPIHVIVVQHHKEAKHAKNTLRIAKLISPSIEIISSESSELFITQKLSEYSLEITDCLLVYPTACSESLAHYKTKQSPNNIVKCLIFIDATWKQAYGIYKRTACLERINAAHLPNEYHPEYSIRSAKRDNQLSTIEALAYSLNIMCGSPTKQYLNGLAAMQSHWKHN